MEEWNVVIFENKYDKINKMIYGFVCKARFFLKLSVRIDIME
jgi:hypothetical protein